MAIVGQPDIEAEAEAGIEVRVGGHVEQIDKVVVAVAIDAHSGAVFVEAQGNLAAQGDIRGDAIIDTHIDGHAPSGKASSDVKLRLANV